MGQQQLGIRDKIALGGDMGVIDPSRKAFNAALGLGPIRYFRSDFRQLGALAAHDTADERCQGGQVPGNRTGGRTRIILC
ncbi:hypothetical protein D3C83_107280 [compost metagenome]